MLTRKEFRLRKKKLNLILNSQNNEDKERYANYIDLWGNLYFIIVLFVLSWSLYIEDIKKFLGIVIENISL